MFDIGGVSDVAIVRENVWSQVGSSGLRAKSEGSHIHGVTAVTARDRSRPCVLNSGILSYTRICLSLPHRLQLCPAFLSLVLAMSTRVDNRDELERLWNLVAVNLGPTPIYDDCGHIVPIGAPLGRHGRKYKVYVVWYGRCVGIFYNWCVCVLPLSPTVA